MLEVSLLIRGSTVKGKPSFKKEKDPPSFLSLVNNNKLNNFQKNPFFDEMGHIKRECF